MVVHIQLTTFDTFSIMTYNVLISGTNKGIGYDFVAKYLNRPNTTVIATVRDPGSSEADSLRSLPKAEGSSVIVVKIESTSKAGMNLLIRRIHIENPGLIAFAMHPG